MLNWILFISAIIFSVIGVLHSLFVKTSAHPIHVVVNLYAAALFGHYAFIIWERL